MKTRLEAPSRVLLPSLSKAGVAVPVTHNCPSIVCTKTCPRHTDYTFRNHRGTKQTQELRGGPTNGGNHIHKYNIDKFSACPVYMVFKGISHIRTSLTFLREKVISPDSPELIVMISHEEKQEGLLISFTSCSTSGVKTDHQQWPALCCLIR